MYCTQMRPRAHTAVTVHMPVFPLQSPDLQKCQRPLHLASRDPFTYSSPNQRRVDMRCCCIRPKRLHTLSQSLSPPTHPFLPFIGDETACYPVASAVASAAAAAGHATRSYSDDAARAEHKVSEFQVQSSAVMPTALDQDGHRKSDFERGEEMD